MSLEGFYLRASAFFRRHGLASSVKRAWREIDLQIFHNRCILYWMDLTCGEIEPAGLPPECRIERYDRVSDVPEQLLARISELYSERLLLGYIQHRFELGAKLWCLKNGTNDLGYIWTIEGRSMKPRYFFPLLPRDVHFDDGLIFPPYRGKGLLDRLNRHVLRHCQSAGCARAFLEIHEWNASSMRSVAKTGFTRFGMARKSFRRGRCLVTWWFDEGKAD